MIKKLNKYSYAHGTRSTELGSRNYEVAGYKLPSVTTVLGKTKDTSFLDSWIKRKGKTEAERIKNESSTRGTSMHKYLENYVLGKGYEDLTDLGQETKRMAEKVIEVGLAPVSEYFGSEVTLYYPGLYAGQTDLVGLHNDKETIIDFKQANRPKKEEWIGDYKLQAGAYAMAHDYVHGSNIDQCIIMICTPDLYYQEFRIDGANLRRAKHDFLRRLDQYYDLMQDEKEKAGVNISQEDYFNGA
jgi:genome maintenance exonuclease 1